MARWVKARAAKPDTLRSIPVFHVVGGEKQLLPTGLWPPHMGGGAQKPYMYIETHK